MRAGYSFFLSRFTRKHFSRHATTPPSKPVRLLPSGALLYSRARVTGTVKRRGGARATKQMSEAMMTTPVKGSSRGNKPGSEQAGLRDKFPAFPFEPYSIQLELMSNLYDVLESGGLGIFESPTVVPPYVGEMGERACFSDRLIVLHVRDTGLKACELSGVIVCSGTARARV